jgi:hypothetical protein
MLEPAPTFSVVGVSAAHSAVVLELSVLHTSAVVVGVPNASAAVVDRVDSYCVEQRPSGTLEEHCWMRLT